MDEVEAVAAFTAVKPVAKPSPKRITGEGCSGSLSLKQLDGSVVPYCVSKLATNHLEESV